MVNDDSEQVWSVDELWAIYNRAPDLFRALDLEDISEIEK